MRLRLAIVFLVNPDWFLAFVSVLCVCQNKTIRGSIELASERDRSTFWKGYKRRICRRLLLLHFRKRTKFKIIIEPFGKETHFHFRRKTTKVKIRSMSKIDFIRWNLWPMTQSSKPSGKFSALTPRLKNQTFKGWTWNSAAPTWDKFYFWVWWPMKVKKVKKKLGAQKIFANECLHIFVILFGHRRRR